MPENFKNFGLKSYLLKAIEAIHFNVPTEVQQRLIPVVLKGKSVVGQSQTGSGKTHTFLLPIFNQLDPSNNTVQAVITTPSRELAYQIYEAAKQLAEFSPEPIHIQNYVGGTDKQRQIDKLSRRQPQIVIGTPGRIADLMSSNALDIHNAATLVVDEADMTLDLGFLKETDQIASALPSDLQMMVFSATIPQKLQPFLKKYMKNPVVEEIAAKSVISDTIENWIIPTKGHDRNEVIYQLITMGQPYIALIFANTKTRVDEIVEYLRGKNLKVAKIHGDVPARERKRVMKEVQNLDFQYVVATDLAARGIDIEGVSHVINDDIPNDLEFFIHRVGRTGRNGLSGIAMTLYEPNEENKIAELEAMGIKFAPKDIKKGEIVDSYDRNRRENRKQTKDPLAPVIKGMVKKEKKKRKPGYKKKIQKAIKRKDQMDRRVNRKQNRKES